MAFVIFAGQSNALGFGMNKATLAKAGLAKAAEQPDRKTLIWDEADGRFEVMVPGVNTGTPANPQAWGPEVGFARAFRADNPNETLHIVKQAKGSTGLAADPTRPDWSPNSKGEMFDAAAQVIAKARAVLKQSPDAVFLVQGEQDAVGAATASAYAKNLTGWLSAIRAEWMHQPQGKVAFARVGDAPAHAATVRKAQVQVDQADRDAASFDIRAQPMQADGLHYAAPAHFHAGQRFYSLFDDWF